MQGITLHIILGMLHIFLCSRRSHFEIMLVYVMLHNYVAQKTFKPQRDNKWRNNLIQINGLAFGFTRLAKYGTFKTRRWILDILAKSESKDWLNGVKINGQARIKNLEEVNNLLKHRSLTIMILSAKIAV